MNLATALSQIDTSQLSPEEAVQLATACLTMEKEEERQKWQNLFPDEGELRRELYPKHLEHFRAGATFRERLFMAANRVGKSVAGATETAYHLTGRYPDWWEGRRFDRPIDAWVAGDTNETTRDIIQRQLLGSIDYSSGQRAFDGVGTIPWDCHGRPVFKPNTNGLLDNIEIKHVSGGWSSLAFKSYEQGRKVFQGTNKDLIWLDEESPMDVYNECLIRTTTTNGIVLLTFTPLLGMSDVVKSFLQADEGSAKHYTTAGWADVPHIDAKTKAEIEASTPPHLRGARMRGEPSLGAGAVYPIDPKEFRIAPFEIPAYFRRGYGMDVGWNRTAAIFGAYDPDNDILYFISEHYRGQAEPSVHSEAIKARGVWQPGFIDPASQGSSQLDGKKLIDEYRKLGLNLTPADNAVEAGVFETFQRLSTGRLKVFSTLTNWFEEYRFYIRDEKNGKIVKKDDHALDAGRYLTMSIPQMITRPVPQAAQTAAFRPLDSRTGY